MKKIYYLIAAAFMMGACSTSKYTASFNSYESYGAKSAINTEAKTLTVVTNDEIVLASTSSAPVEIATPASSEGKTYVQMNKTERKALRNHLRKEIRTYVKEKKIYTSSQLKLFKKGWITI